MSFKFLRILVIIEPLFWLFLLFSTGLYRDFSLNNVILGTVFFLSLLVHEYGHAFTARYFGANPQITLGGFGGKAYDGFRLTSKQQFLVILNGPLLGSVLIVIPYALLNLGIFSAFPIVTYALQLCVRVNIFWCLFSLIPIRPLDGSHLLQYLLKKKWGVAGERVGHLIGLVSVCVVAPCLFYQGYMFFGSVLVIFGFLRFQEFKEEWRSYKKSSPFHCHVKAVEAIEVGKLRDAKVLLKKLLKTQSPHMKHSAIESLAKIYMKEGKGQKAYNLLLDADFGLLKEGKSLLCRLAFEQENYALVAKCAQDAYAIEPTYEIAILNAKAFAKIGQEEMSQAWFATAAQFEEVLV